MLLPLLLLSATSIFIAFLFWICGAFRAHLELKQLQDDWLQPLPFRWLIVSARVYEFLAQT